jgi:hypothetical protein
MGIRQTRDLPAPLEAVRRRFEQWRRMRTTRSRIPGSLWTAAVKMAGTYGLHRTARALPVEYYSLKKRVEQRSAAARVPHEPGPAATFVELPPPVPAGECDFTLELEDAAGAKMRVHLKAAVPPDLAALSRSFWNPGS